MNEISFWRGAMTRRQTRRKNFFLLLNIFIPPDDEECGKWIAIWRRRKSLNFFPFLGKKSSADFKRTIFSLGKRAAAPPIDYKPKSMSRESSFFWVGEVDNKHNCAHRGGARRRACYIEKRRRRRRPFINSRRRWLHYPYTARRG